MDKQERQAFFDEMDKADVEIFAQLRRDFRESETAELEIILAIVQQELERRKEADDATP